MTRTDPAPDVARDATNEPDMAKARELLPCPFCGGAMMFRKALWPSDGCTDAIIHRDPVECGLTAFDSGSIDESVIAAWNSRALTAARDAAIEEAADALVSYVRAAKKARFSEPNFLDAYRAIRALADKERSDD